MNARCPSPTNELLQRFPRELKPSSTEEIQVAIWTAAMEQSRRIVDNVAKIQQLIVHRRPLVFPHCAHGTTGERGNPHRRGQAGSLQLSCRLFPRLVATPG